MTKKEESGKKKFSILLLVILFLLLLIVLTGIFWIMRQRKREIPPVQPQPDTLETITQPETTAVSKPVDTIPGPDTLSLPDTLQKITKPGPDTITAKEIPDTAAPAEDTVAGPAPCTQDTTAPWVYPDPSGGLHRQKITVALHATEPCTIEWKLNDDTEWKKYTDEPISVTATTTLYYRGTDSCGNQMPPTHKQYEIVLSKPSEYCPEDMEYIKVGSVRFCIDRYEWPNKRGVKPDSYISVYQAMDSCFSVDKRLCSMDEWIIACSGPYSWKYPYGNSYQQNACATRDTTVRKSGSKRVCRGYFDVYDMSGNLAEWTSTRSAKDPQYYNVMGGFWKSGIHSSCNSIRYSYFPQNRHNPVGFRCCSDAAEEKK
ncbi:MAG: SUMF1/EgtB/PvdO family nonheme iron enzyme [Chitinivibrionales bacterium]|nr:SUMF1/EgtB/PvdO family nonheme iron enzyme [Chitinivibrionales bacterium]